MAKEQTPFEKSFDEFYEYLEGENYHTECRLLETVFAALDRSGADDSTKIEVLEAFRSSV